MSDKYLNKEMNQIPYEALNAFNNKGYPRINPKTYELEWYINKSEYNRVMSGYERTLNSVGLTSSLGTSEKSTDESFYSPSSRLLSKGNTVNGVGNASGDDSLILNLNGNGFGNNSDDWLGDLVNTVTSWF